MPYLSEIRIFAFDYAPAGWLPCNGLSLSIATNTALYSLLGTTFGGDGRTYFNIPDFRGRCPMNWNDHGYTFGQNGGEAAHALTIPEMPSHKHLATASSMTANMNSADGANWASNTGFTPYGNHVVLAMDPNALLMTGLGIPHQNMSPFLALNICISLYGIFPSKS